MKKLTQNQKSDCFIAGMTASELGHIRAPAYNKTVMQIIEELSTNDFVNHDQIMMAMKLFLAGYQAHCDVVADSCLDD